MKEKILELMNNKNYIPKSVEDLALILDVNLAPLKHILDDMEKEYLIKQTKKKKYDLLKKFNLYVGTIDLKDKGFGFIRCDEFADEFFVPKEFVSGSMDNDKVLFSITNNDDSFGRKEAAVIEIIERSLKHVMGKIVLNRKGKKRFEPNDKKLDIVFEVIDYGISVVGDIVDFEIEDYINAALVRGRISYVIGNINDVGIDIKTIAYKYGFHQEFSNEVISEVKELNINIEDELKRRQVFNGNIITMDGEDAKDLDDAISIKKLDNGNYLLGVYIADVSYYVKENSKLDRSAYDRGTSVYLADRVIPMLPHKLSNDLCSLNEDEYKLVIACIMEINQYGIVVNHEINEGIIKTKHRMTYTNVNLMLEDKNPEVINKYQDIYPDLLLMQELSLILRIMRTRRGSLDFDIPEAQIIVNEEGKPLDVVLRTRGVGEKLIEDFMLIANETVAQTIEHLNLPFIYRVHDEPNSIKLQKVSVIAKSLGYKVNIKKNKVSPQALQILLNSISEEDRGLSTLLLRMMAKAKYSEKNIGHFGLASTCYTHFTSPIRRYPDLIVHRYLRKFLFKGEVSIKDQDDVYEKIVIAANQSSKKERDAIDCEYEVSDMKKAEYMEDNIGKIYEARITSVTNFGIFASLDNTIEGLIHISSLDDYYVYNENQMALIGPNNLYRMGDKIVVEVIKASKELRQIDFRIVRGEGNGQRKKGNRKKQKSKS